MARSPKSLECVVHLVLILSVISGVASTTLKIGKILCFSEVPFLKYPLYLLSIVIKFKKIYYF